MKTILTLSRILYSTSPEMDTTSGQKAVNESLMSMSISMYRYGDIRDKFAETLNKVDRRFLLIAFHNHYNLRDRDMDSFRREWAFKIADSDIAVI